MMDLEPRNTWGLKPGDQLLAKKKRHPPIRGLGVQQQGIGLPVPAIAGAGVGLAPAIFISAQLRYGLGP